MQKLIGRQSLSSGSLPKSHATALCFVSGTGHEALETLRVLSESLRSTTVCTHERRGDVLCCGSVVGGGNAEQDGLAAHRDRVHCFVPCVSLEEFDEVVRSLHHMHLWADIDGAVARKYAPRAPWFLGRASHICDGGAGAE